MEASARVFRANALGPACVAQAFLPLVERSDKRTIVNISSSLGSIAASPGDDYLTYGAAKSALNMFVRRLNEPYTQVGARLTTTLPSRRVNKRRRVRIS